MVAIRLTIESIFPSDRDGVDGERGELKVVLQTEKLPGNELSNIFDHFWCTFVVFVTEEC
jgi:hypothetical protein